MSTIATSTALALNTKAASKLKPPVNKKEIITALATRKYDLLVKQHLAAKEEHAKATCELDRLARVFARAQPMEMLCPEGASVYYDKDGSCEPQTGSRYGRFVSNGIIKSLSVSMSNVRIEPIRFTPAMKAQEAIIKRIEQSRLLLAPDFKDVLRDVKDAMSGQNTNAESRIDALLADPATVKLLDKTLNALDERTNKSIAA